MNRKPLNPTSLVPHTKSTHMHVHAHVHVHLYCQKSREGGCGLFNSSHQSIHTCADTCTCTCTYSPIVITLMSSSHQCKCVYAHVPIPPLWLLGEGKWRAGSGTPYPHPHMTRLMWLLTKGGAHRMRGHDKHNITHTVQEPSTFDGCVHSQPFMSNVITISQSWLTSIRRLMTRTKLIK